MYVQCMYNVCTWYNQLSQQVFMVDREMQMQDRGTSLCPLLLWTIWMEAVPVQKMETFFMPGQITDRHELVLPVTTPLPMFPDSST